MTSSRKSNVEGISLKTSDDDDTEDLMVEKPREYLNKKDLELILEVNKKVIEIEAEVVEQNEEIISSLSSILKNQATIIENTNKTLKQTEDTNRDIFKIQVLFLTGLFSLIIQVIQLWKR